MLNPSVQHTPAPRRILPLIVAGFVVGVVGVGASSSCVVCASDDDCDAGEVCLTGAGCAPTQPPTLRVRPPSDADIVDGWSLTIELGFRGIDAVVEVERSSDNPGDPCVPFGVVRRVVPAPGPQGRDSLQIELSDGVVEIAVVPHIISGPVDAIVRLSRGDTHRAMCGPITLRPELGEVWLAGRVVVHDDVVAAVVAGTEPPAIGLPW